MTLHDLHDGSSQVAAEIASLSFVHQAGPMWDASSPATKSLQVLKLLQIPELPGRVAEEERPLGKRKRDEAEGATLESDRLVGPIQSFCQMLKDWSWRLMICG